MTATITPMTSAHLRELIDLEERYWWHVSKRRLVRSLLQRFAPPTGNLVEGGVGSARNLREWEQMGYRAEGFDLMPESVDHACQRGLTARVHDLEQPWPVESGSCRAVVLLDVIEHTAHPETVLQHAANVLAPGGCSRHRTGLSVTLQPVGSAAWPLPSLHPSRTASRSAGGGAPRRVAVTLEFRLAPPRPHSENPRTTDGRAKRV